MRLLSLISPCEASLTSNLTSLHPTFSSGDDSASIRALFPCLASARSFDQRVLAGPRDSGEEFGSRCVFRAYAVARSCFLAGKI